MTKYFAKCSNVKMPQTLTVKSDIKHSETSVPASYNYARVSSKDKIGAAYYSIRIY